MSGVNPIPSNPFHIARAYQVMAPRAARPVAAAAATGPVASIGTPAKPASKLVAAVVPGRINFAGGQPAQAGPALPMYRHPADKNAAATSLSAGRTIDVQA
jgi:hypothetical protein